jgi:hypothetical protein
MSSPLENAPEEAAWAEVVAAWDDEARHLAYLARFGDLEGLAVAGRRYREALAARPRDPLAARFRDEVVKRAMVQGLVAVPRAAPTRAVPRNLVRAVVFLVAAALGAAAFYVVSRLGPIAGAKP